MQTYIKKLDIEARSVWGECPACGAKPGEPCDMSQGIPLSVSVSSTDTGTHAARLFNAPQTAAVIDTGE